MDAGVVSIALAGLGCEEMRFAGHCVGDYRKWQGFSGNRSLPQRFRSCWTRCLCKAISTFFSLLPLLPEFIAKPAVVDHHGHRQLGSAPADSRGGCHGIVPSLRRKAEELQDGAHEPEKLLEELTLLQEEALAGFGLLYGGILLQLLMSTSFFSTLHVTPFCCTMLQPG
eukprot:s29_g5.t1